MPGFANRGAHRRGHQSLGNLAIATLRTGQITRVLALVVIAHGLKPFVELVALGTLKTVLDHCCSSKNVSNSCPYIALPSAKVQGIHMILVVSLTVCLKAFVFPYRRGKMSVAIGLDSLTALNRSLLRKLPALLAPLALIGGAALVWANLNLLPSSAKVVLNYIPYLVLFTGIGLAAWFNRSRAVFFMLTLLIAHWVTATLVPNGPGQDINGQVVYATLAVLLPINVVVFAFFHERGITSEKGLARFSVIWLQVLVVLAVAQGTLWMEPATAKVVQGAFADLTHLRIFPKEFDAWTYLPQPAILLFGIAAIVLVFRLFWINSSPLDIGFFFALVATAVALHMVGTGYGNTLFFAAGGVIITLSVFQDTHRMAFIDELTGLPGRRALEDAMLQLGESYAIAMLDVDHFKKFNDTHGHDVGDQVLRMVAAQMMKVGGGGRPFRYGGEEFTVLFPNRSVKDSLAILEKLRLGVEGDKFIIRGKDRPSERPDSKLPTPRNPETVSVTISIGVAEPDLGDEDHAPQRPNDVLKAADKALYRAKDGGRNQVSV